MSDLRLGESRIKQRVHSMLARRFMLRFHVALILLWTLAVGLLVTRGLLWLGVESMAVRYPLAVLVAYIGFLAGVRVWLWYVGIRVKDRVESSSSDLPIDFSGSRSSMAETGMRPGGGSFGGGGASGDYAVHPSLESELAASARGLGHVGHLAETGAKGAEPLSLLEGAAGAVGEGLPALVVLLVVGILFAGLVGGAYVIIDAPAVLAEAAFEALLAGGLIRAARRVEEPDWSAAVVRRTWLPATSVLLFSLAFALAVGHYRPEIHSVAQLVSALK